MNRVAHVHLSSPVWHQLLAGVVTPTVGLDVAPLRGSELLGHVPTGQTSPPPRGGVTHKSAVMPCALYTPDTDESTEAVVSITKSTAGGTTSFVVQLGPLAPMNELLPKSVLLAIVKSLIPEIAIPNPN